MTEESFSSDECLSILSFRTPRSALKSGAAGLGAGRLPDFFYCISEKKNAFFSGVLMTVTGLIWFSTRPCETSISLYRW